MNQTSIDLGQIARDLDLPLAAVERTLVLLDEGNTVPFITRFRKDETGGLDEEQIRELQSRASKQRQIVDRKQTILKTIEAQGKLTPDLTQQIEAATTVKRLEDLYLPFKPKKQSLATVARERGLEPLAREIYEGDPAAADIEKRAAEFLSPEKEINATAEVLLGVRHLMAERFSENAELRGRLRRIFQRSGKLVCTKVETPPEPTPTMPAVAAEGRKPESDLAAQSGSEVDDSAVAETDEPTLPTEGLVTSAAVPDTAVSGDEAASAPTAAALAGGAGRETTPESGGIVSTDVDPPAVETSAVAEAVQKQIAADTPNAAEANAAESPFAAASEGLVTSVEVPDEILGDESTVSPPPASALAGGQGRETTPESGAIVPTDVAPASVETSSLPTGRLFEKPATPVAVPADASTKKKKKKKKKKVIGEHAFKDYYDFQEAIGRVPPHRVLAINRGERAKAIRVKIEADVDAMHREAEQMLVGNDHPHAEFVRDCVRDALTRLVIPSLEREIRRELTDWAEDHAVDVFVRNLRRLLLQQPVRGRRVLAIDPGFKSGCKMVALDEFGNVLGHGVVYVIGKNEKREKARTRLADMVKQHNVSVIAIGNGTGCREAEQLVAETLAEELKDRDVAYVVVNEAGASIYSTSPLGREELPQYDALQRGAISIGRRLLDPLSEMVKINPANLGVGLYQHDMKAKNLRESLDAVVESAVNFVGVDVNSASPALLRYVSGMNALTARRIYEYRREHGPFKNREQLKQVPGVGESTFVQAAGFLKVIGGENPLDATWIHPESYEIANRVLEKIGSDVSELASAVPAPPPKPEPAPFGLLPEEPAADAVPAESAAPATGDQALSPETAEKPTTETIGVVGSAQTEGLITSAEVPDSVVAADEAVSPPPAAALAGGEGRETTPESGAIVPTDVAPASVETAAVQKAVESAASQSAESEQQPPIRSNPIAEKAAQADAAKLAQELGVGQRLLEDILTSLTRPGLDPRDDLSAPMLRRGILKLEDLQPGMELQGNVLNVVDFGVFVDIGLSDSGLVHISRLADRYIRDPHEVVGVGDVLKVWVVDVDRSRRRVSLTAIQPGTERPHQPPQPRQREQRPQQPRRPQQQQSRQGQPQGQGQAQGQGQSRGGRPTGDRPPQGDRGPRQGGGGGRRDGRRDNRPSTPKVIERQSSKPKPVKPLTKAMEEGKVPLRSFSDLLQFYDKKKQPPPKKDGGGQEGKTE